MKPVTLGVIVSNRGFFPGHLCTSGRKTILSVLKKAGFNTIVLPQDATPYGAVESLSDARKCAALFKEHREAIDGVLITLPNFGDERAAANTLRFSGLQVPVLVHAFSDTATKMSISDRRDSFCGKMSVCNGLRQYGIPFSLTSQHTMDPESAAFLADLKAFGAVCRVVRALRGARVGIIGARPAAFNTVRFSEKILERAGISVEPVDLSEMLGRANRLKDNDAAVRAKLAALKAYTRTSKTPAASLLRMAKFGAATDRWMQELELVGTAIQCWTAIEEFYGIVPCMLMSMMSNALLPSACETDITGLIGMLALQSASGRPAALLDWNNNYGTQANKGVVFHCSNLPRDFFKEHRMDYQAIIAGSVGKDNTYGTITGRIRAVPFTYCRVATDDTAGTIRTYLGEGRFTNDKLSTFGGYGVVEIPKFQDLLRYICKNGFEHHVAATMAPVANVLEEAFTTYLGWPVYHHRG